MNIVEINLNEIFADEDFNCRQQICPIDVVDLAKSIKANGLQNPIIVQPFSKVDNPKIKYRIISGHRRYTAFIVNEFKTIPCIVKEGLNELQARRMNLEENLKRKDLNILQEAMAIAHFKRAGCTLKYVADELGMSMTWVQVRYNLLEMPEPVQQEAAAGLLTQEQIKQLYTIKDENEQFEIVKRLKDRKAAGEKKVLIVEPVNNPNAKKMRKKGEIFDMIDILIQALGGATLATRALAWASGEISDFQLYCDIREASNKKGINWQIPQEVLSKVV